MFTITFFLLSTMLLGLAFLIFEVSQSSEKRATDLEINNRINDLSSSASNGISEIFLQEAGINLSITNGAILIQEVVKNNNLDNYSSFYDGFASFVESKEKYVSINRNEINKTGLIIMPLNINYYGAAQSDNTKRFISNLKNLNNFSIEIYRSNISVNLIDWKEYSLGSTPTKIIFRNDSKTLTETRNIDLKEALVIGLDDGDGENIEVQLNKAASNLLEIKDLKNEPVALSILLKFNTVDSLKVFMANEVTINVPEFDISKTTKPRIV